MTSQYISSLDKCDGYSSQTRPCSLGPCPVVPAIAQSVGYPIPAEPVSGVDMDHHGDMIQEETVQSHSSHLSGHNGK